MAKTLTMTLPDRVHAALTARAAELEQDAPGWLRMMLITAGTQPDGVRLKLELPAVQPSALPLFEAAKVKVEE